MGDYSDYILPAIIVAAGAFLVFGVVTTLIQLKRQKAAVERQKLAMDRQKELRDELTKEAADRRQEAMDRLQEAEGRHEEAVARSNKYEELFEKHVQEMREFNSQILKTLEEIRDTLKGQP